MVSKSLIFCFNLLIATPPPDPWVGETATFVAAVSVDPCEPDCSAANAFDKVPDPNNCTNFYYCLADHTPTDQPVPCPPGSSFPTDGTGTDCTGPAACTPICGGGSGVACHLTCNGTGDYISDPFDCNVYYECDAAGPLPGRNCPADRPHFDGESCVDNEDICCVPGCDPVCEAAATQIPDPIDCTKFYICTGPGTPDSVLHFDCPSGENFDIGTGHCVAGAECKLLCTSSSPGARTSTLIPVGSPSAPVGSSANPGGSSPNPGGSTSNPGGSSSNPGGSSSNPGGSSSNPGSSTAIPVSSTSGECINSLTCEGTGFYPKCVSCQPEYFFCESAGLSGVEQKCTGGLVFNPIPDYPYCILPSNCPYTP
ncbi:hypothetical protein SK128_005619 [Halocaridina rubra]|uniref:Chitin-binding type-2 domain-containing protein n=1 Tax=Halocaridina rubra TaxID=373956 RepID=A0AAN8XP05_HALRR